MFTLSRDHDGFGDSGSLSELWRTVDDFGVYSRERSESKVPAVGWEVRVGASNGRTFSHQDYWTTTPVTDILSDMIIGHYREIKFRTRNSIYTWTGPKDEG